jgi:hypothetical protein
LGDFIDLHHGPGPSFKKWPLMLKKCLSIASQGNNWDRWGEGRRMVWKVSRMPLKK